MPRYISCFRSGSRESYKAFKELHKEVDITFEKFLEVIYGYNEQIMTYCLESGDLFPLPRGFGSVAINRKKTVSTFTGKDGKVHTILPVDWKKTGETGKKEYHFNDHTDGWKFRWLWFPNSATNLRMKEIWEFKPARKWSLAITEYVTKLGKSQWYKYAEHLTGRNKPKKRKE